MRLAMCVLLLGGLVLAAPGCLPLPAPQADINVYFVPQEEFADYIADYVPGNCGFVSISWGASGDIFSGTILVATDTIDQLERDHVIREELTQSLGLLTDSYLYPDSIFYQLYSWQTEYAPIDRRVIEMLYHEAVRPDMTAQEAAAALGTSYTDEEIAYFQEIASGGEYSTTDELIHKWTDSPAIRIHGTPTPADLRMVRQVIDEINDLTGEIQLELLD